MVGVYVKAVVHVSVEINGLLLKKAFFFSGKQINLSIYMQNLIYYMHYLPFTTRAGPLHAQLAAVRMMYDWAHFSLWQWIINLCIIGKR